MTHSDGKQHEVGDRGQRYEVTYFDPHDNKRKVFGWSETPEGARELGNSIDLNPSMEYPQLRDREAKE